MSPPRQPTVTGGGATDDVAENLAGRTTGPADTSTDHRQHALTAMLSCFYASERHRHLRPHCKGVAVVAYGPIALCTICDAMRSGVGKGMVARAVPGAELAHLVEASRTLVDAQQALHEAGRLARTAGASWGQIGDAVGVTRQAAQQRWATTS